MPAAAEDEDRDAAAPRQHLRLVGRAGGEPLPADTGPSQHERALVTTPPDDQDQVAPVAGRSHPDQSDQIGSDPMTGHDREGHHHWHLTHDHHILIEPEEDRWEWRRKIRRNPRQLFFYRLGVALAGLLLVAAGLATGPLPGPGGIPLVLLGVAVWSSEFEWAHKLMQWLKGQLHRFRQWSRGRQAAFWVAFFACCGLLGYLYLVVLGVPGWLPQTAAATLRQLPGV
jgi:uncharacterized protein (TIGR02611 family)